AVRVLTAVALRHVRLKSCEKSRQRFEKARPYDIVGLRNGEGRPGPSATKSRRRSGAPRRNGHRPTRSTATWRDGKQSLISEIRKRLRHRDTIRPGPLASGGDFSL